MFKSNRDHFVLHFCLRTLSTMFFSLLTVTVISSSFMKAFLVQSTHKQLNERGRVLTEVIVLGSAGNFRQIPLRCRWSGTSKELSPAVPLPLLFDVLTSFVQPPERSPYFPQSASLLLWNVYRNFMSSIRTKFLSEEKGHAVKKFWVQGSQWMPQV